MRSREQLFGSITEPHHTCGGCAAAGRHLLAKGSTHSTFDQARVAYTGCEYVATAFACSSGVSHSLGSTRTCGTDPARVGARS